MLSIIGDDQLCRINPQKLLIAEFATGNHDSCLGNFGRPDNSDFMCKILLQIDILVNVENNINYDQYTVLFQIRLEIIRITVEPPYISSFFSAHSRVCTSWSVGGGTSVTLTRTCLLI